MAEEKIYFEEGDVKVTNARFLTYGKMHSMANVTSVAKLWASLKNQHSRQTQEPQIIRFDNS